MQFALFQSLARTVADVIFPVECVGCGKGGVFLCTACLARIHIFSVHFCHYCQKPQAFGQTCPDCRKLAGKLGLDGLYILAPYDQRILKDAIHTWKYERVQEIGNILGSFAAMHLMKNHFPLADHTFVTSVPLARQKQFDRGFNQATQLARVLSNRLNIPFQETLLRIKNTKSQFALPKSERKQNMQHAFAAKKDTNLRGASILLIDDVTTTGATLEEACQALKKAGAINVYGIALAHGS